MSIGIVMYVEFPQGTNRADAERRAQNLLADVQLCSPGSHVESHGVMAKPDPNDKTTFESLKRAHLRQLGERYSTGPAPDERQVLSWRAESRQLRYRGKTAVFSPKEWALLTMLRDAGGRLVPTEDLYRMIIGGGSSSVQLRSAQISTLRNRVQGKLDTAFGPRVLVPFEKVWRQGMLFHLDETRVVIQDA